jgi:ribosomal protein S18 acetylase RimI-like enzyme
MTTSTSSAFRADWEGPPLTASVHQTLTSDEIRSLPIRYRSHVSPDELAEIRALHAEWFPVDYAEDFYESIIQSTDILSIIADVNEKIVGLATVAIRRSETRYNFSGDLLPFLGLGGSDKTVAYILTLGVVDELRGRGIASELLRQVVKEVPLKDPMCGVIFLHVIEYNKTAMRMYRRNGFETFKTEPEFYKLGDEWFSGILFYLALVEPVGAVQRMINWINRKLSNFFKTLYVTHNIDQFETV